MEDIEADNQLNQYERRLERQQQKIEHYERSTQKQQMDLQNKSEQLSTMQDQLSEMQIRLAELGARLEQSEQTKEGWREAAQKYKLRLKTFENEDSTEDLKRKVQQKEQQLSNLSDDYDSLQQKYHILEQQLKLNDESKNVQLIEKLLKESDSKDKSLKLMVDQVAFFQKEIQGFNSKLVLEIAKTESLEGNIKKLTQDLKDVTTTLKESENTVQGLKSTLARRENQISSLQDKLSVEYKRKEQGSDHLRQKQAILKDYIELEKKFCLQLQKQQQHEAISLMLQQEINNMKHSTVSRTHYEMLTKRYLQLKKALEAALRNKDNSKMDVQMPILKNDQSYEGRQIEHYQKLCSTLAELQRDPQKEEQFASLFKQNQRKGKIVEEIENTIQIYEAELKHKQVLLQDFAQRCFKYSSELSIFQKQQSILKNNIKALQNQNDIQKMRMSNSQARQMELLTYIGFLQKECTRWKNLSTKTAEAEVITKEHYIVEEPREQQIQVRVVEARKNVYQSDQQVQTETVEYHLDELKRTAAEGREFIKKLSEALEPVNSVKAELESEKTRYIGIFEAYKTKMREVKAQRQGLEEWKGKTKEQLEKQIREEFLELRQFLDNDRLLNCLKKAKYLIEEFEKGQGQNEQVEGQPEGQPDGQTEGQHEQTEMQPEHEEPQQVQQQLEL